MRKKPAFPVYLDLSEKKIVVIGGGSAAERRVCALLDFAGEIQVISPQLTDALQKMAQEGEIRWLCQNYEREKILDADMVLACTSDANVNNDAYVAAECLGIMVNSVTDLKKCDFFFPEVSRREDLVVGVFDGKQDSANEKLTDGIRRILEGEC
jgi:siroheme synthase-like protein